MRYRSHTEQEFPESEHLRPANKFEWKLGGLLE